MRARVPEERVHGVNMLDPSNRSAGGWISWCVTWLADQLGHLQVRRSTGWSSRNPDSSAPKCTVQKIDNRNYSGTDVCSNLLAAKFIQLYCSRVD